MLVKSLTAAAVAAVLGAAGIAAAQEPEFEAVPVSACFLAGQLNPGAVVPGATAGNDVLVGTPGDDIIAGGSAPTSSSGVAATT